MKTIPKLSPLILALSISHTIHAEEWQLEEVVVTAQKRAQSAQDVPISITAVSGDFIERKNISSVTDMQKFTPGLRIPQADASKTSIRIRGVGSHKFDIGSEGSVGVFLDEVYLPRFSGSDIGLLDLERVEVLKGPQGTIFGRNTAAGAISVNTRRPSQELEAFIETGIGNKDSHVIRGAISGPLTDQLSGRLSLAQEDKGGFQTNTQTGSTDDREVTVARGQLMWETDTWSVIGALQYSDRKQDAVLTKSIPTGANGAISPVFAAAPASANSDFRDYSLNYDGEIDFENWFGSLRIERDFDSVSLVSITGYQSSEGKIDQDVDASSARIGRNGMEEDSETFSQELRLVGENWLTGVYYYNDDAFSSYEFCWEEDSVPSLLSGPGINPCDNSPIDLETTAWALFGEYRIDLTDTVSLTLGMRYSYDHKEFTLQGLTDVVGVPAVITPYTYSDEEDWDSIDPKVSLTWMLSEDTMVYASYNEGYKAGGVQFSAFSEGLAQQLFDPEELTAYEVGFKSDLLDNTLRVNGSMYFYDYQDLHVQRVDLALTGSPAAFTSNAAESEIKGLELDLNWVPVEGLDLRFAYSFLKAEYKDYVDVNNGTDYSGNTLPVSPEHTVTVSADYTTGLTGGWKLAVGTDWTWIDDQNFDVIDDPYTHQDSYALGAARIMLMSPEESLTISGFVENLSDKEYYSQLVRRGDEVLASQADGRRYGIRVRYNF
jgi:iron complex outermembrane recepter protein